MKNFMGYMAVAVLSAILVINVHGAYKVIKLTKDSAPGVSWHNKTNEEKRAWIELAREN